MIKVVGLGNAPMQITLQGIKIIQSSSLVIVKTNKCSTYSYFQDNNIDCLTLDNLYESADNFDDLNSGIVDFILQKSKEYDNVCYCVKGSGYDDRSVMLLVESVHNVEIIPSVSLALQYSQPTVANINISAYELVNMKGWNYDTRMSLLINDIDDNFIASELKLILASVLGEEQQVFFNNQSIFLYELDRQTNYDHTCALYCPPLELKSKHRFNIFDLLVIMYALRGENGCPWDKEQTHLSIRNNLIEEAYELVQAINNDDLDNIIEETGDVLLQAVFHSVIGEDCGEYDLNDALSTLCRKLIDRHTHIFGDVVANNSQEALVAWENAKAKEKKQSNISQKLNSIAQALPALQRAKKAQNIAKKVGYEFQNFEQVVCKINEELGELLDSINNPNNCNSNIELESGDLLFAVVNALRWQGIDGEVALSRATDKFISRLEYIEKHSTKDLSTLTEVELDTLWQEAKNATRQS